MADFDPDAYLQKREQKPPPQAVPPPPATGGFKPDVYLGNKGAAPPIVGGAPDPVRYYAPGAAYGFGQSLAQTASLGLKAADYAGNLPVVGPGLQAAFPPLHAGKLIPKEVRERLDKFANEPYSKPGQQAGYITGEVAQTFGPGAYATGVKGLGTIAKEAATLGGIEGAWQLAEFLTHSVLPHGLSIPTWLTYRMIRHFGAKGARNFFKTEVKKALEDELKGAKGAGTFIPKTVEGGKGGTAAKPQSKVSPQEEAAKPTAAETAASSQKAARNILKRTSKEGDISSTDIAAAKLAKMTGAIHPGEEEVVEEFARMPVRR